MSGLEVIGGVAAVAQLVTYALSTINRLRIAMKGMTGRMKERRDQLEAIAHTVSKVQENKALQSDQHIETVLEDIIDNLEQISELLPKESSYLPPNNNNHNRLGRMTSQPSSAPPCSSRKPRLTTTAPTPFSASSSLSSSPPSSSPSSFSSFITFKAIKRAASSFKFGIDTDKSLTERFNALEQSKTHLILIITIESHGLMSRVLERQQTVSDDGGFGPEWMTLISEMAREGNHEEQGLVLSPENLMRRCFQALGLPCPPSIRAQRGTVPNMKGNNDAHPPKSDDYAQQFHAPGPQHHEAPNKQPIPAPDAHEVHGVRLGGFGGHTVAIGCGPGAALRATHTSGVVLDGKPNTLGIGADVDKSFFYQTPPAPPPPPEGFK